MSQPGRSLLTMSLSAYVEPANTLREIAILDPSNRAGGMTRIRRDEILKQLRMQVENGRKLFVFANTNAGEPAILHIKRCLSLYFQSVDSKLPPKWSMSEHLLCPQKKGKGSRL